MLLLAFYALLRIGEYTVRNKTHNHSLQKSDIIFKNKDNQIHSVEINIRHSKCSSVNKTLHLKANETSLYCPVLALKDYMRIRPNKSGPLFLDNKGTPISPTQFSSIFRKLVNTCNLDDKLYKPHSLRIGGATRAHNKNYSPTQIQSLGRWKSSAYQRYLRTDLMMAP